MWGALIGMGTSLVSQLLNNASAAESENKLRDSGGFSGIYNKNLQGMGFQDPKELMNFTQMAGMYNPSGRVGKDVQASYDAAANKYAGKASVEGKSIFDTARQDSANSRDNAAIMGRKIFEQNAAQGSMLGNKTLANARLMGGPAGLSKQAAGNLAQGLSQGNQNSFMSAIQAAQMGTQQAAGIDQSALANLNQDKRTQYDLLVKPYEAQMNNLSSMGNTFASIGQDATNREVTNSDYDKYGNITAALSSIGGGAMQAGFNKYANKG
jgi:hypothetical protein